MKNKFVKQIAIGLMAVMLGCASPVGSVVSNPLVITAEAATAKPKLSASKKTIYVGGTLNLTLKNVTKGVKWSTSNKKVATVKANGTSVVVTGKKAGKATITATYKKKKYKCVVTVKAKPVSISAKKKTLTVGDTFDLTLKNGGSGAKWSTSKKSVATIKKVSNTKYTITAKKAGTANIKVKYKGKTYTCKVTVKKVTSTPRVTSSTGSSDLKFGESMILTASGMSGTITWSVRNDSEVKIEPSGNKCKVTALERSAFSQLYVTATSSNGETADFPVNVVPLDISKNTSLQNLKYSTVTLKVGEKYTIDFGGMEDYVLYVNPADSTALLVDDFTIVGNKEGRCWVYVNVGGNALAFSIKVVS